MVSSFIREGILPVIERWWNSSIQTFTCGCKVAHSTKVSGEAMTQKVSSENKKATIQACRCGRLDLVHTLRERDVPWDGYVYCDQLDCPQLLHQNRAEWDTATTTIFIAAQLSDYLNYLQYFHHNGCPWDYSTANAVVLADRLEFLQYVMEKRLLQAAVEGCVVEKPAKAAAAYVDGKIREKGSKDFTIFMIAREKEASCFVVCMLHINYRYRKQKRCNR